MTEASNPSHDPAALRVSIAPDRLTARLHVPAGFDRALLQPDLCAATLQQAGVEINDKVRRAIDRLVRDAQAPGLEIAHTVARAQPPVHGQDGRVEWRVDENPETDTPPPAPPEPNPNDDVDNNRDDNDNDDDDDGAVNHYDRSAFTIVKSGDTLGHIHLPTVGEDGRDVTGQTLQARQGQEAQLTFDETILLDAGSNLIAQTSGALMRADGHAMIEPQLEIPEYVDFSTGNINFNGDVVVQKGVRDCFTLKAEGDIEVRGLIEAATIIAGRDLIAAGGFAGREQGNAQIGGCLKGRYLDNIRGQVEEDLCIDREIINCRLTVHGSVLSPSGSVIGGRLAVTRQLQINQLGSPAGASTEILIGCVPRYEPLADELGEIVERYEKRRQELIEEQNMYNELAAQGRPAMTDKQREVDLASELSRIETCLQKGRPTLDKLHEVIARECTVDVSVERRLCHNVRFIFAGKAFTIRDDMRGPVQIAKNDGGELVYRRRDGPLSPITDIADVNAHAPRRAA